MKSFLLLLMFGGWCCGTVPLLHAQPEFPQVHRTFVPEAGPSAFVVTLSPTCVLIYDPLRGGINAIYQGQVDFTPTLRAKINEPVKFSGKVIYQESQVHPLSVMGGTAPSTRQFLGYRYEDDTVVFRFKLNGIPMEERLHLKPDTHHIIRKWSYPKTAALRWILEPQLSSLILNPDGESVPSGPLSFPSSGIYQITIAPNPQP